MYFHQIDRILYGVLDVFILVYYMKGVLSFNTYVLGVLLLKEVLIKHIVPGIVLYIFYRKIL